MTDPDLVHLGKLADTAEPGNVQLASESVVGIDDQLG